MQLVVGRVSRAHGIRGEVAVEVRTDDPETRFSPGSMLATQPTAVGPLRVSHARWHAGRLLVVFAGVTDRTAAEALRGTLLLVDSAADSFVDNPEARADPDEFWDHQLLGLSAVDAAGRPLGDVTDVLHLPGQDLLVVRRLDGAELLVPFVRAIVPDVDLVRRMIVVEPPPGLLDIGAFRRAPGE